MMWVTVINGKEIPCIYDEKKCFAVGEMLLPSEIAHILRDAEREGEELALYEVYKMLGGFNFKKVPFKYPDNFEALERIKRAMEE